MAKQEFKIIVPINVMFPQLTSKKRYPYTAVSVKDKTAFVEDGFLECSVENLGLFTLSRKYYPYFVVRGRKEYVKRQVTKLLKKKYPNGEMLHFSSEPYPIVKLNLSDRMKTLEKKEEASAKFMQTWLNKGASSSK
jgi:hypothetical protein